MKNILILLALFSVVIVSGTFILDNVKKPSDITSNTELTTNSDSDDNANSADNTSNEITEDNSALEQANSVHTKINSFNNLKTQSDLIVEVTGTDKYEEKKSNYIAFNVCTVNVNEVIKGSITPTDLQILLDIDVDPLPEDGKKYLMFLKKETSGSNNYYVPVGYGQGIYKIVDGSNTTNNSTGSSSNSSTATSNQSNTLTLQSNSPLNSTLFTELKGKYSTIKTKLK